VSFYVPDAAGNPAPAYLSVRDVIDNQVYLGWLISMLRLGLGAVILLASLMCFLGASWDIHWHTLIGRDRILIPPHGIMLGGVALSGIAATADIVLETIWADCAQHVLHHFEQARPRDDRPRRAIELGRAWARGEITMTQARTAAFAANAAAKEVFGAAREAAHAAGQAVAVAHVAAHELGAAAYAIRAARAATPEGEREEAGRLECQWQRAQLSSEILELVLDDQRRPTTDVEWFALRKLQPSVLDSNHPTPGPSRRAMN